MLNPNRLKTAFFAEDTSFFTLSIPTKIAHYGFPIFKQVIHPVFRPEKKLDERIVTTNIVAQDEEMLSCKLDTCEIRETEREEPVRKGFLGRKKKQKVTAARNIGSKNKVLGSYN